MMRKHLTAALILSVLALVLTNPLALQLWHSVQDKQDALLNTWITAWVGHALVTDPLNLFNSNIFYPYPNTLAFSEILLPPSLLALALTFATHNPIFGYNVSLLAMLWLDAFGMYLLVYDLTKRAEAGWVAGAIYAFNSFNLGNLAQLQLLTLGFLPLAILFLRKVLEADARRRAVYAFLFTLFFILQALSSFYYALLAAFAVGLYLAWWLFTERNDLLNALRRSLISLAASCALISLVLIPFLLPYFQVQGELGFSRRVEESEPFSASLKQFTEVSPQNLIYGRILAPDPIRRVGGYPLDNLFPGVIPLALALFALLFARTSFKTYFAALLVVSFVLALGPRLYLTSEQATDITLPYRWLYEIFSPLRALRAPVRFDALINFALAGLAGFGAADLSRKFLRNNAARFRVGIVLTAFIAIEYLALPAANAVAMPVANEIPKVYKWLAQQPHGVILELPMMGPNQENELDISTQYYSTYHWQDTPDGYSGFVPPRRGEIAYEMQWFPSLRSIALLHALGVDFIVDHVGARECYVWSGPIGWVKPQNELKIDDACIYSMPRGSRDTPNLGKKLYVPTRVAADAPFHADLILQNRGEFPYAVKPTDRVLAEAHWSDGRIESLAFEIPLVTSSVSVVPVTLHAPAAKGDYELEITSLDALIGEMEVGARVHVGSEIAREVVLPASVGLVSPLPNQAARGDELAVDLRWLPYNKINAYYSASVRLVNEQREKVTNVDRQPRAETFLWRPDEAVSDEFQIEIPREIPIGKYRVELLMYQADTGVEALLLDKNLIPQTEIVLGEIVVK